jgi:hypothetical protein
LKNVAVACLSLAVLLASGCASSTWARTEKFSSNGDVGRLYVPRLYAPLRPGSIYPDRRTPVPAKGRPAVIVVCPAAGKCPKKEILGPLAERGLVVLLFEGGLKEPPKEDLLRTRPEAAGAPQGLLLVEPTGDFLRKCMGVEAFPAAVAILSGHPLERIPIPVLSPSSPSKQIFGSATRRVMLAALHGSEAKISSEGVVEKLYAASPGPAGGLPSEAFRDAAEWLASELGAR